MDDENIEGEEFFANLAKRTGDLYQSTPIKSRRIETLSLARSSSRGESENTFNNFLSVMNGSEVAFLRTYASMFNTSLGRERY